MDTLLLVASFTVGFSVGAYIILWIMRWKDGRNHQTLDSKFQYDLQQQLALSLEVQQPPPPSVSPPPPSVSQLPPSSPEDISSSESPEVPSSPVLTSSGSDLAKLPPSPLCPPPLCPPPHYPPRHPVPWCSRQAPVVSAELPVSVVLPLPSLYPIPSKAPLLPWLTCKEWKKWNRKAVGMNR
ncbi:proline-rich receptor-like protein kinase PERK9 isoform X3 [Lathyrus oleraceus]|uniref:proline-rich receptor-like protein kinase PERK9 isoform X3 n=1 Tax=Pisum sativum TaxID=3888 RepID=UPI0021D27163|nr:proline-rich receptor-like protein kinase PERK9 isoform X3 [Pisum sativum]